MKKIKLLFALIILLLTPISVFASTNTYDRNTLDNYGVNKKWEITTSNKYNVLRSKKVDAKEKIYDFADILTDEEEEKLLVRINNFISKYKIDFVFMSDRLVYSQDKQNEDFAADFYDYNDFGMDFEKYSGILLFRNNYEADKYYDMYLFGNTQLYFDQHRKDESLDGIYSYFKSGDYYNGINKFLDYCERYYDEGVPSDLENYRVNDMGYLYKVKGPYRAPWAGIIGVDCIITLITIIILVKKNKMVQKKLKTMDYLEKNSVNYTKKNDIFVSSHVSSYVRTSSSGGGGGGYHSSGGSSGGGHSSGGGRHG